MAAALVALVALLLPALASACIVPSGSCTKDGCAAYDSPSVALCYSKSCDTRIAFAFGNYNTKLALPKPADSALVSLTESSGYPALNFEVFPAIESAYLVNEPKAKSVTTLGKCCDLCRVTDACALFQFFPTQDPRDTPNPAISGKCSKFPVNFVTGQQCYLLSGGSQASEGPKGAPFSGKHSDQVGTNKAYPPSFVGGTCNGGAGITDDPHLVGALGTHYDFNGDVGKTYSLISDAGLNVNIRLMGYLDTRTFGASLRQNGSAVRTWIEEVGLTWSAGGARHTAVLVARPGVETARAGGFLAKVVVDSQEVAVPGAPGAEVVAPGFALRALGVSRRGPYEVESFSLEVGGKFVASIQMRPAHRLLRSPDSAHVHFNINVERLDATPGVHGILGQTYRHTAEQQRKAMQFQLLSKLAGHIAADSQSGRGFLEGSAQDYETSALVAEDSKFSAAIL